MKKILIFLIRSYQKISRTFIYPSTSKSLGCKFYPSCSEYSILAIEKYGAFKGVFLSIKRVLKCNPWRKPTIDPLL